MASMRTNHQQVDAVRLSGRLNRVTRRTQKYYLLMLHSSQIRDVLGILMKVLALNLQIHQLEIGNRPGHVGNIEIGLNRMEHVKAGVKFFGEPRSQLYRGCTGGRVVGSHQNGSEAKTHWPQTRILVL